jgi:hypothetical protein
MLVQRTADAAKVNFVKYNALAVKLNDAVPRPRAEH